MADAENGEKGQGGATHGARPAELPLAPAGSPAGRAIRDALPVEAERAEKLAPQRGPGRPLGSKNKRDTEIADALIETYGDPLEADVAIGTMEPGELITTLRCLASDRGLKLGMDVGDILRFQAGRRDAAMNYLHSKRAQVDPKTGEAVVPVLGFGTFSGFDGRPGDGAKSIEDVVKNQQVIDVTPEKSDGEKSDDAPSD